MGWLEGYVAAITGGANGIGLAVARRYLAEGAAGVAILDRDTSGIATLSDAFPGRVTAIAGDVRDPASHSALIGSAVENHGRLDVLVGNAGVFDFRRPLASYEAGSLGETFDEIFGINLKGYMLAALAARDALSQTGGSMIFTGSVASQYAGGGGILYTAAKHAIVGFIRELARELAPSIRVNGVGPGGTLTSLRGTAALGQQDRSLADNREQLEARLSAAVPLRFAQRPEDHCGLYVLLASRENSPAVTGEMYMSDGGVGIRPL
ncbi:SDR family NAD(P)-dependent oxidoreductase [Mesorhizobium sp. Z1-4]|uniref:SDR family NAD(P)-dependent oxidoreductase n=1 Tax=Mesorhizobium sp. Z1-4 TaxID=2448478 RepID=UPI000FD7FFDC|nr:SDR family NAD(P)-dependent oxidoreductase [Mesorhizobium sp. Z1-4]